MPLPVSMVAKASLSEQALVLLDAPKKDIKELSLAVESAAKLTNICPVLITVLMYTESTFKKDAISSKGYKGLMQTDWATMKWADVDTLYGVKMLTEKLEYSKGDLHLAIALYKGGNNNASKNFADATLKLYSSIKLKCKNGN